MPGRPRLVHPDRRAARAFAGIALALAAGACRDSPVSIPGIPARVTVVAGDGQRGLAGETLPRPIEVRVSDEAGRALSGHRVDFQVTAGSGAVRPSSATTDASGTARAEWTLGGREIREQRLAITVAGGEPVSVGASAVGADETDVIELRGALGPMKGVVIVQDPATRPPGTPPAILQERASPQTVIPLHPLDGGSTEVVVFPSANAPEVVPAIWTPGIDTLRVDLRPPVPVGMTVTVAAGPFETRREILEVHLESLRRIWSEEGVGLELSTEVVDATAELDGVEVPVENACVVPWAQILPGRIHVYYVERVGGNRNSGLACPPGLAFVAAEHVGSPNLLAHEIGHLLGLDHVPFGLMQTPIVESFLTEGQIFRIHFTRRSAIELVFRAVPPEARRDCAFPFDPGCLPVDYELP